MKKYIKDYMDFHDIGEQDIVLCKVCGAQAVDLHHIVFKSTRVDDSPSNLIPVCRKCHEACHSRKLTEEYLKSLI